MRDEFPLLRDRIFVENRDANEAVHRFCAGANWSKTRAVMFLDPFGNQVNWKTIEVIASTQAIDLWYLFPAHLGINRQIAASGAMEDSKAASLDRVLGTTEWRDEFLGQQKSVDLWGNVSEQQVKQATVDSVTRFMIRRMKAIFAGTVLDEWLPLGRGGSHWYSLLFACANPSPKANEIAERLARAVMKRK
jgi:three-Cys-motif partner protein